MKELVHQFDSERAGYHFLALDQRWHFKTFIVAWRVRYDNPIPTRFLAPRDCSKIPARRISYMKRYSPLASELWYSCSRPKYQPHEGARSPSSFWALLFCSGPNHLSFCTLEQLIVVPLFRQTVLYAILNSGTAAWQNFILGRDMVFQRQAYCHYFDWG